MNVVPSTVASTVASLEVVARLLAADRAERDGFPECARRLRRAAARHRDVELGHGQAGEP
jgi:hypothetical protein